MDGGEFCFWGWIRTGRRPAGRKKHAGGMFFSPRLANPPSPTKNAAEKLRSFLYFRENGAGFALKSQR